MQKVKLNDAVSLSRLVYGMWRLGDDTDTSAKHVQAKIEACLAQGITTMDQADIYGGYMAEEIMGGALKAAPALKDKSEIVTKCDIVAPAGRHSGARVKYYDTSAAHITQSVDDSLRLMDVEKIDVLLVHRPDPFMDAGETGEALDGLVASGKVASVGVSNFKRHDWTLLQSAMSSKLVTNQIEMSLVVNDAFTNGDLAYLQEFGIAPMAWSPLAGGTLFDGANKGVLDLLERIGAEQGVDAGTDAVAWQ
jgi:predicted oxidoreductase